MHATDAPQRPRLADRLGALRDKYFVGRAAELETFRTALRRTTPDRPVSLLFVHGPGGIGKSVLLRRFRRMAAATDASVVVLDGRDLEPSPPGFLTRLCEALGVSTDLAPATALAALAHPVLLIDTYEVLRPLDTWLREQFLPQLPEEALVVLAGRQPPTAAWSEEPAWNERMCVLPLRNLPPEDSRAYLDSRGVPREQHLSALEFTRGHPLALSLLTNLLLSSDHRRFQPERAPDLVRTLLERFVDQVPSQAHWRALAICAHARVTTEALLAKVLGATEAPALFAWLRDLPFIEEGAQGLFPHDVARDVLDADLRWRDPSTYGELHTRIRDAVISRLQAGRGLDQQGAYFDLLYLVRHSPLSRAYYDWTSFGHVYAEPASKDDHASILAMVAQHEGQESARIAEYWLARRPEAFVVFRDGRLEIAGFCAPLLLERVTDEDLATDPAIAAAWRFVAQQAPLRPGERIMHHRFFVGREGYQDTATHNMVAMVATSRWLTTPRLAWSFPIVAEPERWRQLFEPIRFRRTPDADFTVAGRRYGAFSHDWRVDPVERWIDVKTALDPSDASVTAPTDAAPPLEVLSYPDFEAAVRLALRDLRSPALADNPLLRSRLTFEHAHGEPSPASLRVLIRETAAELHGSPRLEKLHRALVYTYLEPAGTQELAAERLGLPFNTYRYQLTVAIKRLTQLLWQRELGEPAIPRE